MGAAAIMIAKPVKRGIIRAGTKTLVRKNHGLIGSNPSPEICVITCDTSNGDNTDFPGVSCFSTKILKHLWHKDARPGYMASRSLMESYHWSNNVPSAFQVVNNQILWAGYGNNITPSTNQPCLTLYDLGLSSSATIPNPSAYVTGMYSPEIYDVFTTSDGKIFLLTNGSIAGPPPNYDELATTRLYCLTPDGSVIDYWEITQWELNRMAGQLEADGVFRVYLAGWCGISGNAAYCKSSVICLSFDGADFVYEWTYTDADSQDITSLNDGNGRGFSIYTLKPTSDTIETCVLVSILIDTSGTYPDWPCTARITVIQDGAAVYSWDLALDDIPDDTAYYYNPSSTYNSGEDTLAGNPHAGNMDTLECAIVYRNCNHYLYCRGSSFKYPDTLFRYNLTTGDSAELSTIDWSAALISAGLYDNEENPPPSCKLKLMGVYDSPTNPYDCTKIVMMSKELIVLVSIDDLETSLGSQTCRASNMDRGYGFTYDTNFVYARLNRQIKFS
jgi:hypothetical protein